MDIRRFFTSPKSAASSVSKSQDPDKNSNVQRNSSSPKKNTKSSKRRRIIESDSDEDPIPKTENESKRGKSSQKQTQQKSSSSIKPEQEKIKTVTVSDFFGVAPIIRNEKGKNIKNEKTNVKSVHEDSDFEATLKQLKSKSSKQDEKIGKHATEEKTTKQSPKENDKNQSRSTKKQSSAAIEMEIKCKPKKTVVQDEKTGTHDATEGKTIKKSPKENGKSQSRSSKKRSSTAIEIEIEHKPKKTVVVDDTKPPPKKHKGSANYASYLAREGPRALGSKEIPEGEDDCLAGLTFVITGVLESVERDEAKSLIEKHGGKVMTTLSKNTKYIVIGRDAGASKLDKAEKFGTKQLDEDELFDLIRTRPGKNGKKSLTVKAKNIPKKTEESVMEMDDMDEVFEKEMAKAADIATSSIENVTVPENKTINDVTEQGKSSNVNVVPSEPAKKVDGGGGFSMWVDKYKPTNMKQVIGQQGEKSNAKKLFNWLANWRKNRLLNKKAIPGRFNPHDDGSGFKAALLSGPPGVGKTTTAQLVCKEAGFDYFELNASDTRSKKYLQQSVFQLLGNQTLSDCFHGETSGKVSSKHAVIMDEVDGMAGNEDRGGMRELIDFIKASKVPIICICNDRNHPKIRSLSNYCFDLRFQRPRVEQIKAAMMSVAFKEGIKVVPNVLQDIIVASNQDIRQVLHNMSVWSAKEKGLTADQTKSDIGRGTKHIKLSPFDVLREVFAIGNRQNATIMDKSDLFFHDYSIAPLFVQENYLYVVPTAAEGDKIKHLTLLSEAADSICMGDIIDRQIRTQSSWSLLPTQAIFASVVPGELLKGRLQQMINFPAWLGKNSNRNHMDRVLQELHVHMRMKISGNKTDVALEYLPLLKRSLTTPLIEHEQEGVPNVLKTMEQYYLLREDFDSIIDLSLWPGQTDPRTRINSKVKSAFTRAYNKECGKNPYSVSNVKKKKGSTKDLEVDTNEEMVEEEEEEEDDSIENDAMIKVKKPKKSSAASTEASTSTKEKKKNTSKKGKSK